MSSKKEMTFAEIIQLMLKGTLDDQKLEIAEDSRIAVISSGASYTVLVDTKCYLLDTKVARSTELHKSGIASFLFVQDITDANKFIEFLAGSVMESYRKKIPSMPKFAVYH